MESTIEKLTFRSPRIDDAVAIWQLIRRCPPLDVNSSYAYLLLCHHFAGTCVVAESDGEVVGFVSGYVPPTQPETFFVWQVAVDSRMRGRRLGRNMIVELLARARDCQFLETTVSPSNSASRRMFDQVADAMGAQIEERELFTAAHLAEDEHEEERLLVIGPFHRKGERQKARGE